MTYQLQPEDGLVVVRLLQASDGNLWILTADGGPQSGRAGAVFAITTQGAFLTRVAFDCSTTGCSPSGFIQTSDGAFYGSAGVAGKAPNRSPMGTLFKIDAGLPKPGH